MKAALFAIVLGIASLANASPLPSKAPTGLGLSAASALPSFEAANRKGSTRVGGSGRSGKGGKYVGGRRK
ncbi:MAG: hypothetical protein EON54_02925 [Alcaligenaceae bacterium]|nr:MAG: hypothetical protein EON54_02925 [Alcaligenaceae bacterium]